MIVETTLLTGVLLIHPPVFEDARGFFFESYVASKYRDILGELTFLQDNFSKSQKGTIRGLHYQIGEFAQGKLCQVITGMVLDVAVDIRFGSPTFGKYFMTELSSKNHCQLWIPPGFAHGFSVVSDEAVFHYKCTNVYSKQHERGIRYNDPAIGIDWKNENPIVSEKDTTNPLLAEIQKDFFF